MNQSGRTETIVRGLVPFISENILHQGGLLPEAVLATFVLRQKRKERHRIGNRDGVGTPGIDGPKLAGQSVLRPPSVRRRTESWIAPATRPSRRIAWDRLACYLSSPCNRRACDKAVALGSVLGSQRVFQNTSLPLKNARCTPAARAASTLAR